MTMSATPEAREFTYEVQSGDLRGVIVASSPQEAFNKLLADLRPQTLSSLTRWRRTHRPSTPESRKAFPRCWHYQTTDSLMEKSP